MTCLQLRLVPDSALRQALLKASLDKNTNVEYSNVSLNVGDTKEKHRSQRQVNRETRLLQLFSLPDVHHADQLLGDEPQREGIQEEGEDTEHHLGNRKV